ncbi:rubrerythrin family protein [Anaerosacchariphilus polymeriproducens]|uniref:Rubrerythrin family protein n=1 Tax=Anaerosacchariphilus polymeriproducens TaxID=1812858 RepID=A0A371AQY5_9FIRM|nr:rubrerythrin family protein [Anaerosacchariphilus polymeriproducens]RDU21954.1 rubrerythrin family protein [Anaerosacchariphilus polymeriproducens]
MDFQQSETYKNLLKAYEAELLTSAKFEINADIAQYETYIEIRNLFMFTANNNRQHARIWLRKMNQGNLPTTVQNLLESTRIETQMASDMYQQFAETARREGFLEIAALFSGVANIDYFHAATFSTIYENIMNEQYFCKPVNVLWICLQCGNILSGECAPLICPVCGFPQGYYKLFQNVY